MSLLLYRAELLWHTLVRKVGFEPTTPSIRMRYATGLRYLLT